MALPEFRALLGARLTSSLASSAMATIVAYQVYLLTFDPLALGWLGLVEAAPAISLALFGGHLADRRDRRAIVLISSAVMAASALLLAIDSIDAPRFGALGIFAIIFVTGVAGGFQRPATSAFEAQVIPIEQITRGTSWASSTSQLGAIAGPAMGGILYGVIGAVPTYLALAGLFAISTGCMALISRKAMPRPEPGEDLRSSLFSGVRFVARTKILLGSMALDLFAVLFGGAMAMLPIFVTANGWGSIGLGLLRTAPSIGALLVMLIATRRPPTRRAGPIFLACVAGFGLSIIVFAWSGDFVLSMAALFISGVTDGVSMIVRSVIVRVSSPEAMRARIASVNWVFIGASNEIGAFESGVAARLLGVVPSVAIGGFVTLLVVATVAFFVPELRRLDLTQPPAPPAPA